MKITGGTLKNRVVSKSDQKNVRPTSSRIREAVFSMIGQDLSGLTFWDAYGGSGIMGIEAYSRSAKFVLITEQNHRVYASIKNTIRDLHIEVDLIKTDYLKIVPTQEFDIIFLDPPYDQKIQPIILKGFQLAKAIVIAETDIFENVEEIPNEWHLWKRRTYGNSQISIFKKKR